MHGEDGIIRTLLSRAAGAAGAPDPRQATSARWSSSGTVQKMSVEIVSSSSSALHTPEDVQAHTGAACTRADTDPEIQSSPSATARARRTQLLREEAHGGIAGRHSSDRHAVMAISPEHTCLGPLLAPPSTDSRPPAMPWSECLAALAALAAETEDTAAGDEGGEVRAAEGGAGRVVGGQGMRRVEFELLSLSTGSPWSDLRLFERLCVSVAPPRGPATHPPCARVVVADLRDESAAHVGRHNENATAGVESGDAEGGGGGASGGAGILSRWAIAAARGGYRVVYVDSSGSAVFLERELRSWPRAGGEWAQAIGADAVEVVVEGARSSTTEQSGFVTGLGEAMTQEPVEVACEREADKHTQAQQLPMQQSPLEGFGVVEGAADGEAEVAAGAQEGKWDEEEEEEEEEGKWKEQRAAVRGRLPVVFLHWTMAECRHCEAVPPFLPLAIRVAVAAGNHVVLVGDNASNFLQGPSVTWIPISALMPGARALDSAYQHASSNPESYEKGCMQRPFLLRSLLHLLRLQRVIHLDSDVLLLVSGERWLAALEARQRRGNSEAPPVEGYWLRPRQSYASWHWVESIATSILSLPLLDALTDFILRLYSSPQGVAFLNTKIQEYVVKLGGEGGVCDMTAYYLFSHCVAFTLPPWSGDFPQPHHACPPADHLLDIGNLWLEPHGPDDEMAVARGSEWDAGAAGWASMADEGIFSRSHPIGLPPGLTWEGQGETASGETSRGVGRGGVRGDGGRGLETFDLNVNDADGNVETNKHENEILLIRISMRMRCCCYK